MTKNGLLSFSSALLITLNIMLGMGVFINTVILSEKIGSLSPALYAVVGLLIFPLILSMAQLAKTYKDGNFYTFGSLISPFFGFISTWGYFLGKLGTATLAIHVFNGFIRLQFQSITFIPYLLQDIFLIMLFVVLNTLNIKTGSRIQYGFIVMKLVPILIAIFAGFITFDIKNFQIPVQSFDGIFSAIPLAIFCCLGFEASCSLSSKIENSQKNAPRAIIGAFLIAITLLVLYQFFFYGSLGKELALKTNYLQAFPAICFRAFPSISNYVSSLCALFIATSALGGAYGLMYSNLWNLFTIASKKHLPYFSQIIELNSQDIPYRCAIIEGAVCILYIISTQGSQIPLQYVSTLSSITAYTISIFALFKSTKSTLSFFALMSCIILMSSCIKGFISTSLIPLFMFGFIIILGSIFFFSTRKNNKNC